VGEELEFAQAERGESEIEQRLNHVRPTQQSEDKWDPRPNVVESDDYRAEYEIQNGDREHTGFTSFSEKDEEVYPHPRPHHVRDADDHEVGLEARESDATPWGMGAATVWRCGPAVSSLRRKTLNEKAILMIQRVTPPRRGAYGIDAPYAPAFIAVLFALELALAVILGKVWILLAALFILAILGFYLHGTLRGKFVVWAELLDTLNLRGDERILDMGCGRGAVLLMAAQHLTTGSAVGVDLWRSADQSGNSPEATRRNAIAEGVADRVEVHTGDMTALPFTDGSFDVVVSSLAIHNIRGRAGRVPSRSWSRKPIIYGN